MNVAVQFAWHKLVQSYSGDPLTVVGTTVSGRYCPLQALKTALACTVIPCRVVDWSDPDASVSDMLHTLAQDIANLNSYSGVSLSQLQANGERLFHSLFVFENYPKPTGSEQQQGMASQIAFRGAQEKVDYPLALTAFEQAEATCISA